MHRNRLVLLTAAQRALLVALIDKDMQDREDELYLARLAEEPAHEIARRDAEIDELAKTKKQITARWTL
jgi:hypothetical protein